MFTSLMLFITISISVSLINTATPIALGLWILLLALSIAVTTSASLFSWFGFMVFLIYIGGMLVMFAYFMAIQPNQHLSITLPASTLMITFFMLLLTSSMQEMPHSSMVHTPWITALFNMNNIPIILLLGLILFLALLVVVKVSSFFMGPLRPFMYV